MKYWQWLCVLLVASALLWAMLGYAVGPSWLGMICAALVGHSVATALWMPQSYRWRALFEEARDAFKEMADLNEALIENRVMFHLHGESMELPDEHKPSVH